MATSPLFGWEEPDDTDLVKDGAAAIRTLGNAIDTSMGDLLGGTTGQVLSKASNTNMDFVWVTNADGDITGVTAGTGLTGGGTSGSVTVSLDTSSVYVLPSQTGYSGKYLTTNGTVASWATVGAGSVVACRAKKTTSQTLSNGTWTAVTFNTETYDTDSIHDISTNTSRFTVPTGKGGKWIINASCVFAAENTTGERNAALYVNGAIQQKSTFVALNGNQANWQNAILNLSAGDYVELYVYQSSGGNASLTGDADGSTTFNISYLGA